MKILFPCDVFDSSVYFVGENESLVDISLKVGSAPHFLISDNNLASPPKKGEALVVKRRGKIKVLDVGTLLELSDLDKKRIMAANGLDYLFVGQIVLFGD